MGSKHDYRTLQETIPRMVDYLKKIPAEKVRLENNDPYWSICADKGYIGEGKLS